jgi:hypothetical protein
MLTCGRRGRGKGESDPKFCCVPLGNFKDIRCFGLVDSTDYSNADI